MSRFVSLLSCLTEGYQTIIPVSEQSRALAASLLEALTVSKTPPQHDTTATANMPATDTTPPLTDDVDKGDGDVTAACVPVEETEKIPWEESPTLPRLNEDDVELDMDELDLGGELDEHWSDDEEEGEVGVDLPGIEAF